MSINTKYHSLRIISIALLIIYSVTIHAAPLSTAITYQGELQFNDSPAEGLFDFEYHLNTDISDDIVPPITLLDTSVEKGIFTVELDFGISPYNGEQLFLEILVRQSLNPSVAFEILTPDQPISASPYALHAEYIAAGRIGTAEIIPSEVQVRVSGICAEATVMTSINQDGTVNCVSTGGNTSGITGVLVGYGLIGGGSSGEVSLALDPTAIWLTGGNTGAIEGTHYIGTTDASPLDLRVNQKSALRIKVGSSADSPNIIAGSSANSIANNRTGIMIAGGTFLSPNIAYDSHAVISGGSGNIAGTDDGSNNEPHATIGGGSLNKAIGENSTVSGGRLNQAMADNSVVGGGEQNVASVSFSTIAGGYDNIANATMSAISGGFSNEATGDSSVIGGGHDNFTSGHMSTLAGGISNQALARESSIGGGGNNITYDLGATIGGGRNNISGTDDGFDDDPDTTVSGGNSNQATAKYATTSGGNNNKATADNATVGGGNNNKATADHATVGGGGGNLASGNLSTIGGGASNTVSGEYSTVGGGALNDATGRNATVGGGALNNATGLNSTIGGGNHNLASEQYSTISGGLTNRAEGSTSSIGGGSSNTASGSGTNVSGGRSNLSEGPYSTIPGGKSNKTGGAYSFAAGRRAIVRGTTETGTLDTDDGTFVWADSTDEDFVSTGPNQFLIRSVGGVGINTNAPQGDFHIANDGVFTGNNADTRLVIGGGENSDGTTSATITTADSDDPTQLHIESDSIYHEAQFNYNSSRDFLFFLDQDEDSTLQRDSIFSIHRKYTTPYFQVSTAYNTPVGQPDYGNIIIGANMKFNDHPNDIETTIEFENDAKLEVTDTNSDMHIKLARSFNLQLDNDNTGASASAFRIKDNTGTAKLTFFTDTGNLDIAGTLSQMSDRNQKHNIVTMDTVFILDRVLDLEINEWSYLKQDVRHIGPMAQDFHAAFGLGKNETTIDSVDSDGIALAAIQGLAQRTDQDVDALMQENEILRKELGQLLMRVKALESSSVSEK